jgi:hypothetical protein
VFVARFRSLSVFHWPGTAIGEIGFNVTPGPAATEVAPAPVWCTSISVLTGNATDAFGGIVSVFPAALFISTVLPASASTNVYVVPVCGLTSETWVCAVVIPVLNTVQERGGVVVRGGVRDERAGECVLRHKKRVTLERNERARGGWCEIPGGLRGQ